MTELMSRDANESAFMFLTELEVNSKDCRGRRPEPNIKSDGNLLLSCGWSWTGRWRQADGNHPKTLRFVSLDFFCSSSTMRDAKKSDFFYFILKGPKLPTLQYLPATRLRLLTRCFF